MSASNAEPIAVVGMGCRFPGRVETPGGLWQLAADGRRTAGLVPADRWDAARLAMLHDPELMAQAAVGCFLEGDVWAWEPEALSVAPIEREWVDPQSRVMMEVAWEAVEHAGIPLNRVRGSRTGVYVGTYAPDNLFRDARPVEDAPNSPYLFGNYAAGAAGRVAFAMDLRGPVMVISTHCSSGIVALDAACGALTLGECDMALAGGVLLMLAPQTHYMEAPLLLSRAGACHAFDARADGYVRGEGAGAVVLKRLADARRDGDRVLAVIRGSAVNNDGQATRLTAPSTEMQQQLFRSAVELAGIDPGDVGLVEAHGPGTAVGDPIEYTSIQAVYGHRGRGRCALGSLKTNIGHTEPVSGIAGLIKAVECLRRGLVPPNQNFAEWNPGIDREQVSRLFVPTELTAWPVPGRSRLAAVCSYGVSGTNGHVVLEAAPAVRKRRGRRAAVPAAGRRLFLLSGTSEASVKGAARRLADWAEGEGRAVSLEDIAHTLALRRRHAEHRLGIVADRVEQLIARARAFAGGEELEGVVSGVPVLPPGHAGPVFVFTGQGSQYPGMCRDLLAGELVFAAAIDELEPLIRAESGLSLRELIGRPEELVGVERIQPVLFGVQVALAALWRSWGVEPAAVIGQSLGEVAAAVVAGVLSPSDGAKVICRRSALLARIAHGAMASVMLGADEVQAALDAAGAGQVAVAVLTAPRTTVISGDAGHVRDLVARWEEAGTVARLVDVGVASHSPQVDPVIGELGEVLAGLAPGQRGPVTFYSTVSDEPREPGPLDASYWVRNQRHTVRFHHAVAAALADGHRLFIECTAHPLAARPVNEIAAQEGITDIVAVGSLRRGTDDAEAFLAHLGAVHCAGFDGIDFSTRYGRGRLADVPTTCWNRTHHGGITEPYALVAPSLPAAAQHPLLGGHVADPGQSGRHLWQTPVSPSRLPWLADHQVAGVPVLPGTGFAEMLLAAGTEVLGTDRIELEDLHIEAPLVLDPEPEVNTQLIDENGVLRGEVLSRADDGPLVHARATIQTLPDHDTRPAAPAEGPTQEWSDTTPADLYRYLRKRHNVRHGPSFAAIDRIQLHPSRTRAVTALRIAGTARVSAAGMRLHPALADEFVHSAVAAWIAHCTITPGPVVVAGIDAIRVYGPTSHARHADVTLDHADDLACTASGTLARADGTVVAEITGLRLTNITPPEQRYVDRLAHLAWQPEPAPTPPKTSDQRWLVIAPEHALWGERLAALLGKRTTGSGLLPYPAGTFLVPELLSEALDDSTRPAPSHLLLVLGDPVIESTPEGALAAVRCILTALREATARTTPPRLWVMWRGGQPLTAAGVRGLLRVAAFEHPELQPSSLEVSCDVPLEDVLADLLADTEQIAEIAWHHGVRTLARVRPGPAPQHAPGPRRELVRADGSYLITGGLGGLGLLTARRLAERGARGLILIGRTAPSRATLRDLEALHTATGTMLEVITGDIADPDTVQHALTLAGKLGTLRGIVHAAGVIEDATLARLDEALLRRVWRGKAEGAWTLHQATCGPGTELDFFVVYSSIASLIGSPGQGAYAAANAYLDALVTHRLAEGLPATGIHWGAWSKVGRGQHLAERGFLMINPDDGVDAFERILTEGHHQIAYSPIDPTLWTAPYPALRTATLLTELLTSTPATAPTTSPVLEGLHAATASTERHRVLADFIIDTVRELLGGTTRHIGPHTSLVALGLDSLGAVQLQQRLQRALRTEMKPGVIWVKPSAASLSEWLLKHLGFDTEGEESGRAD
ncbi:type I polyketide synthase [Streptomyces abikoensis]|uniref:type I polyketide synthase n=1 Tax=Streptomyces abikoensis TaxID=97398 RepID=UPI0033F8F2A4